MIGAGCEAPDLQLVQADRPSSAADPEALNEGYVAYAPLGEGEGLGFGGGRQKPP